MLSLSDGFVYIYMLWPVASKFAVAANDFFFWRWQEGKSNIYNLLDSESCRMCLRTCVCVYLMVCMANLLVRLFHLSTSIPSDLVWKIHYGFAMPWPACERLSAKSNHKTLCCCAGGSCVCASAHTWTRCTYAALTRTALGSTIRMRHRAASEGLILYITYLYTRAHIYWDGAEWQKSFGSNCRVRSTVVRPIMSATATGDGNLRQITSQSVGVVFLRLRCGDFFLYHLCSLDWCVCTHGALEDIFACGEKRIAIHSVRFAYYLRWSKHGYASCIRLFRATGYRIWGNDPCMWFAGLPAMRSNRTERLCVHSYQLIRLSVLLKNTERKNDKKLDYKMTGSRKSNASSCTTHGAVSIYCARTHTHTRTFLFYLCKQWMFVEYL